MNNLVIFDYDDTIYPTYVIKQILKRKHNINRLPIEAKKYYPSLSQQLLSKVTSKELIDLYKLSWCTYKSLQIYIKTYSQQNIFIVSLSKQGWIKQSLSIVGDIGYYKHIYELLFKSKHKITMIHPPNNILPFKSVSKGVNYSASDWKFAIFRDLIDVHFVFKDESMNKFLCIGDSQCEYHAAGKINNYFKKANLKIDRIKLMKRPSICDMIDQQIMLKKVCDRDAAIS